METATPTQGAQGEARAIVEQPSEQSGDRVCRVSAEETIVDTDIQEDLKRPYDEGPQLGQLLTGGRRMVLGPMAAGEVR